MALPLPIDRRRRADITFTRAGLFIFIDGCFWHGCPEHYQAPRTNAIFWADKVRTNRQRDIDTTRGLLDAGFTVARFWEHDPPERVADLTAKTYRRLIEKAQTSR